MSKKICVGSVIISTLLIAAALIGLWKIDQPLADRQPTTFQVTGDDSLVGYYYPGEIPTGVILLEGFGSDQTSLTPIAREYAAIGAHVLTFDFSGHGRSPGGLDFDNASTDRMAKQVLAATAHFQDISGLEIDQIYFLGHSLGARVGLQAATMMDEPPAGLVLLGTQINLTTNTQSEFFTGTSDSDLEWINSLGPDNPDTKVLLVSGTWDDILPIESARLLSNKLRGKPFAPVFVPNVLHNYEIYSPKTLALSLPIYIDLTETAYMSILHTSRVRLLLWLAGTIGLFLSIFSVTKILPEYSPEKSTAQISHLRKFLLGKLWLWLLALIPGILISSTIFFSPFGKPVFNLYYIGFFGGYGVVLWLLYKTGKMPGVEGKVNLKRTMSPAPKGILVGLSVFVLVTAITAALARSGWFHVFSTNHRLIWLLLFTPITALGFVIGYKEITLLKTFPQKSWSALVNSLISLLPFFLYTGFLAVLGSTSGVVGSLQGLIILALSLLTGNLIYRLSNSPWLAALCQAFLLYWLILPQGPLFR